MQSGTFTGDAPDPRIVFETVNAFHRTAALRAAIELDIFTAIGEGHQDLPSLAKKVNASERGIRILCDYLVIIGLLNKQEGRYLPTPTTAVFLDSRSPASLAETVRFLNHPHMMQAWSDLTTVVRTGTTQLANEGTVADNYPVWVEFARGMAPMMRPMTAPLAGVVERAHGAPLHILDIAAGHGLFGIEFLVRNPAARVTALDWPAVLEVAQENAAQAGVSDRYRLLPGSAFDVDFGGPYDAILLTNFLHHFDKPGCIRMLRKCRAALDRNGVCAALEFVPDEDRVSPPAPAAFSLIMLATTPAGDAYTYREYEEMFLAAGYARVSGCDVERSAHEVVIGHAQA